MWYNLTKLLYEVKPIKRLLEYDFEYVQDLEPVLNRDGTIKEFSPQEKYTKKEQSTLNKYGEGTFCKFSIHPKWSGVSGVYAFFIDDNLVYIGQALDFLQRFNSGYGNISARCCFVGGQSTNCKINKVVMNSVKEGKTVSIYFHITNNYHHAEKELIQYYNPKYNTALRSDTNEDKVFLLNKKTKNIRKIKNTETNTRKSKNPSIDEVREYIQKKLTNGKLSGLSELIIQSGEIHRELYMDSALPTVCNAMRTLNADFKYDIIEQPPKGNGSRLVFKYKL